MFSFLFLLPLDLLLLLPMLAGESHCVSGFPQRRQQSDGPPFGRNHTLVVVLVSGTVSLVDTVDHYSRSKIPPRILVMEMMPTLETPYLVFGQLSEECLPSWAASTKLVVYASSFLSVKLLEDRASCFSCEG